MRDLPLMARLFINILLFCIYVLVISVIFSFLFPIVLQILGLNVLDRNNPIFDKIQIFILFSVFLVSLIFRKYFYIMPNPREKVESYTLDTHKSYTQSKNKEQDTQPKDDSEEEIKIYVEKEIK